MNRDKVNEKKKKILFYNWVPYDDPGGAGGGVTVYLKNLIDSFCISESEIELYFLSSGWAYDASTAETYLQKTRDPAGKCKSFEIVNSPIFAPNGWIARNPAKMLEPESVTKKTIDKFIEDNGPFDIIHFHNIEGLALDVFSLKEKYAETKFLLTLHNYAPICPMVNYYHYGNQKICDGTMEGTECLKCINAKGYKIYSEIKRRLKKEPDENWMRFVGLDSFMMDCPAEIYSRYRKECISVINKYIDCVLAVSKRVADIFETHGIDKNKLFVSYIGTKAAENQLKRSVAAPSPKLKIAFLGYASIKEKGFDFFINALSTLGEHQAKNIDILIAAKNCREEYIRDKLKKFHSVTIKNGYKHEELDAILKDVHLGVIPVLWEDNLPQVAIEMVAHGVPILCSSYGGASELCASPLFKFEGGNAEDMLSHILHFVNKPSDLNEFWNYSKKLTTMSDHIDELKRYYEIAR